MIRNFLLFALFTGVVGYIIGQEINRTDTKTYSQEEVEEEIEKMIEEYENEQKRISKWSSLHYDLSMYIKTLQELLQKFKS